MTIPDYQTVMLPLLDCISDGEEHHIREAIEVLADRSCLNEEKAEEGGHLGAPGAISSVTGCRTTYIGPATRLRQRKSLAAFIEELREDSIEIESLD